MNKKDKETTPVTVEDLHVHVYVYNAPDPRVDQVLAMLGKLTTNQESQMADLSDLQSAVEENTAVDLSAITLINGLADEIERLANANDPAALQAFVDQMRGSSADLAAAVAARTPAAPPPDEAPAEPPVEEPPAEEHDHTA